MRIVEGVYILMPWAAGKFYESLEHFPVTSWFSVDPGQTIIVSALMNLGPFRATKLIVDVVSSPLRDPPCSQVLLTEFTVGPVSQLAISRQGVRCEVPIEMFSEDAKPDFPIDTASLAQIIHCYFRNDGNVKQVIRAYMPGQLGVDEFRSRTKRRFQ